MDLSIQEIAFYKQYFFQIVFFLTFSTCFMYGWKKLKLISMPSRRSIYKHLPQEDRMVLLGFWLVLTVFSLGLAFGPALHFAKYWMRANMGFIARVIILLSLDALITSLMFFSLRYAYRECHFLFGSINRGALSDTRIQDKIGAVIIAVVMLMLVIWMTYLPVQYFCQEFVQSVSMYF